MGRVAVQIKKSAQRVGKLVYRSKGPVVAIDDTGNSNYMVRRYGKPNSPMHTYMTHDLYMLPPNVLPCEQMDTPDMRYLNSGFAPIKQPSRDTFDIESYNTHWYDDEPPSRVPTVIRDIHMPLVLPLTVKPLSNQYEWNEESAD